MKSNFLLLISLVLSLNVFSQSCPRVLTETREPVLGSSPCKQILTTSVLNPTSAKKGIRITIYPNSTATGTPVSDKCYIVDGGQSFVVSDQFDCTPNITVVSQGSTAGNNECLAGNVCNIVTTDGTGVPPIVAPVKLTSFNASRNGGIVSVKWTSESEIDFKEYQVEMNDGAGFKTLGTVLAKNNSAANSYSFEKSFSSKQSVQYRLKMIDIDGKFTYSKTALVKGENQSFDFNIYPNPSSSANTNILISGLSSASRIQVTDIAGRVVKNISVNSNNVHLGDLPTGVFMVKLYNTATNEQVTKRLVIVN